MIEMMMEAAQDVMGSKDSAQIIRGKRTKRPRPSSLLTLMFTTSSSSSSHGESSGDRERIISINMTSPSTSVELTDNSIGEEEDMANCLILLAQGHQNYKLSAPATATTTAATTTISSKAEASTTATAGELYVYQCKACNRSFPSFQALGGHRASHKKPKITNINEEKRAFSVMEDEDVDHQVNKMHSLQISNKALLSSNNNIMKSNKVHECSICGAQFSSGQALGGHMRRHRTFISTSNTSPTTTTLSLGASSSPESQESKKPRINSLELDLNLPAPEDIDARESKFPFASKEQVLVFSASPLVDCHY